MNEFNINATHPLQTLEWGKFRQNSGVKVIRSKTFLLTIHKIPTTPFTIGYLPKGTLPTKEEIEELREIGKRQRCIFIQLEPNIQKQELRSKNQENPFKTIIRNSKFVIRPAAHPLFTKYTFILDLTKSEDELLKNMHSKTRYNIRVAQKHGVEVVEDNSDKTFEEYLKLTKETTSRQGFFAHTEQYHRLMWKTLGIRNQARNAGGGIKDKKNHNSYFMIHNSNNKLTAHLLVARYNNQILVTWIVFVFKDTLYYPYGASSSQYREIMASNLMMWEAIKFGKKLGLKKFDMWGALSENPDPKDPWFGFHKFKLGYGAKHVEFVGSYDLVINPVLYELYKIADKVRWFLLKFKK